MDAYVRKEKEEKGSRQEDEKHEIEAPRQVTCELAKGFKNGRRAVERRLGAIRTDKKN